MCPVDLSAISAHNFLTSSKSDTKLITGFVRNAESDKPLAFVTIWIEGTSISTQTDADGQFSILIPTSTQSKTLSFRLVGFRPKNVSLDKIINQTDSIGRQTTQVEPLDIRLTPEILQFEDVVITSSPTGSGISYQPDRAYSGEELHRKRDITIGQMLDGEPGVAMRSMGPAPARPVIRGLDGERILILENGERMGDLSESAADHSVALDPNATDRLEIVRGPASLLYGSSALGGVINLITSDIPHDWTKGSSGSTTFSGASMNKMGALFARYSYGGEQYGLSARFSLRTAGDMSTPTNSIPYTGMSNMDGSVGYGFRSSAILGGFNIMGMQSAYGIPGAPDDLSSVEIRFQRIATQGRLDGHFNGFFDKYQLKFHVASFNQQEVELTRILTSHGTSGNISTERIPLEYQQKTVSTTLNMQHRPIGVLDRGVVGLNIHGRVLDVLGTDAYTPGDQYINLALFTFQEIPLYEILRAQFGVRFDYRTLKTRSNDANPNINGEKIKFNVAGSIGLNYRPVNGLEFGVQFAKAHRYPTVEELFSNGAHLGAGSYEIGDPDLKTENGIGLDFFTRWSSRLLKIELATFYTEIRNFIRFQPTGEIHEASGFPIFRYMSGDARLLGGEISGMIMLSEKLSVTVGSDFVQGTNLSTRDSSIDMNPESDMNQKQNNSIPAYQSSQEQSIDGKTNDTPLPMMPPLRFRVGGEYSFGSSWFGGTLRYVTTQDRVAPGEDETKGYALLAFQAGHRLDRAGLHRFVLRAENVLNTTYRDHLSRIEDRQNPMPGRNITIVYSWSF